MMRRCSGSMHVGTLMLGGLLGLAVQVAEAGTVIFDAMHGRVQSAKFG